MKKTLLCLSCYFGLSSNIFSFEINTHQAITRCAITNECKKVGASNLDSFVKSALLVNQSYTKEIFEGYGTSYFLHMSNMGEKVDILPNGFGYLGLIEAGVVLEDAEHVDADIKGDGRYNNHFYAAQFNSKAVCTSIGAVAGGVVGAAVNLRNMLSDKALCAGYGKRTDNISWALNDSITLAGTRNNQYTITDAFGYYRESFKGTEESRRKNQAKLFVSLGSMVHLIQDLHSPAHVRDGSHPLGDYLEIYGRQEGGFYLHEGSFNHKKNNSKIVNAISEIDINKVMLSDNQYSSYQDFYQKEALWVSENFFSEAHNDGDEDQFDTSTDRDTIFDAYNVHLKKNETTEVAIPGAETDSFGDPNRWRYIKTLGNVSATVSGNIPEDRKVSAIIERGYLGSSERMMAVVDGDGAFFNSNNTYDKFDKTPLEHTAINVIPRAVASTQGFINFFFRGKIKATLKSFNSVSDTILIENISEPDLVSDPSLLTFKTGTKIDIFYIDPNGVSKELYSTTLSEDLPAGESKAIYVADIINANGDFGDGFEIIVLLDGQLGEDVGLDSYSIDARGLSVAYASSRVTDSDILFSFDKSGSMGSAIEDTKSSAIDILDNVIGVDNDTVFVEVDAFSSNVDILSPYSKDIIQAKNAIQGLYSGGGTALYDAIKVAGNNAVSQKSDSNSSKSVIILYTDGLEGSSSSSKEEAINAISVANSPEIDEVFLIFVGNNSGGQSDLKDIAAQSGRKFLSIDSAESLRDTIDDILKGN